jgi:hypothetical protein
MTKAERLQVFMAAAKRARLEFEDLAKLYIDYEFTIKDLRKTIASLRAVLTAIREYGTDTESGYPEEICYDQFAYKRIVDSYRDAARNSLDN